MKTISADDLDRLFTYRQVTDALGEAFADRRQRAAAPPSHDRAPSGADQTLLLMPAWSREVTLGHIGVKIVTVTPDNGALSLPAVMGSYILMDGKTGTPQA
jgi:ornithine cyclodeaminase/alanine dehydrogenase-like protein (mu-crystallin family)